MNNYKSVNFDENNLTNVLEKNYSNIYNNMIKEDYILEYNSFNEFREILFENESVGFLTLDTVTPSDESLCLKECYILPEFRGNGLLIDIIQELLNDENINFYIRKPNYSFIKFLLKHNLAFEIAQDLVSTNIEMIVKVKEVYSNKFIKRLYKKSNDGEFVFYTNAFHTGFCSVLSYDMSNIVGRRPETLVFHMPRKEDLKKHQCRKKLNRLSVKGIEKIQNDYHISNETIQKFNEEKSKKIDEHKDDEIIVESDLKPDDFLKIQKACKREKSKGNLTDKSSELRADYLLDNFNEIDKTVNLKNIKTKSKHLIVCPFCDEYCKRNVICENCGQVVNDLFETKGNPFSIKNLFRMKNNFDQLVEKGYVGDYNLDDKIVQHCLNKGYDINEVIEVQKELSIYEIVNYISQNRIYFNPPSYGYYNHLNNGIEEEWACELGYLRKISDDEFVDRIHNEYSHEDLVKEVEVYGMKFSDEEMKEEIARLKKYTEQWVRDIYEVTSEGIEFSKSSRSMEIFSKYLTGFIYYEFKQYYDDHESESDLEICEGFVKYQLGQLNKLEIIRYYKNYLWYKFRLFKNDNNTEKMIIKIIQIAIYDINMLFLKEEYSFYCFGTKTRSLLKYLDNIDKYFDIAFDEFKLDLLKDRKDKVYKALNIFLNGDEISIAELKRK